MKSRIRFWGVLLPLLFLSTLAGATNRYSLRDLVPDPANWTYSTARVAGAVDGDTLKLVDGRNVRLLGVDAPELSHPGLGIDEEEGGKESRAWAQDQLVGKTVRLYQNKTNPTEKWGRVLALVFYWGGGSFNIDLIENGHAKPAYLYLKPDLNDPIFEQAAQRGGTGAVGLVNVNTSSEIELDAVNGISLRIAREIVSMRAANGPFPNLDSLLAVKGIGPVTLRRITPFITF